MDQIHGRLAVAAWPWPLDRGCSAMAAWPRPLGRGQILGIPGFWDSDAGFNPESNSKAPLLFPALCNFSNREAAKRRLQVGSARIRMATELEVALPSVERVANLQKYEQKRRLHSATTLFSFVFNCFLLIFIV